QAEDGIRDRNVTGVQTCALPILLFRNISKGRNFNLCDIASITSLSLDSSTAIWAPELPPPTINAVPLLRSFGSVYKEEWTCDTTGFSFLIIGGIYGF